MAPKLAGTIRIEDHRILIDGQELPWYVEAGTISVDLSDGRHDLDRVTLTLLSDKVEVDHTSHPARPNDEE
ncbi:autotransporter translocation and assembly factor TamB [Frigoribacterium sp. PvP120]|uniref:hypothetical protein n=1 Tax=unclassified Frigoribacterium TaxID=2627005 RepID=UPI001AE83F4E|nr:hypothetical protein [Frigoribacterium sp. PvP121]MBP1241731.1 autotransporter translocation and assembly factor TamB [Frigoribacterium sp. PvP121]